MEGGELVSHTLSVYCHPKAIKPRNRPLVRSISFRAFHSFVPPKIRIGGGGFHFEPRHTIVRPLRSSSPPSPEPSDGKEIPKVAETCNFEAIMDGYYMKLFPLNPGGIRPAMPSGFEPESLFKPHNRESLSSLKKNTRAPVS